MPAPTRESSQAAPRLRSHRRPDESTPPSATSLGVRSGNLQAWPLSVPRKEMSRREEVVASGQRALRPPGGRVHAVRPGSKHCRSAHLAPWVPVRGRIHIGLRADPQPGDQRTRGLGSECECRAPQDRPPKPECERHERTRVPVRQTDATSDHGAFAAGVGRRLEPAIPPSRAARKGRPAARGGRFGRGSGVVSGTLRSSPQEATEAVIPAPRPPGGGQTVWIFHLPRRNNWVLTTAESE